MKDERLRPHFEAMTTLEKANGSSDYESQKTKCMDDLITDLSAFRYSDQLIAQMKKLFMANNVDRARKLLEATPKPFDRRKLIFIIAAIIAVSALIQLLK